MGARRGGARARSPCSSWRSRSAQGAIGQGDLKLLVSVGLLAGAANLFYGLVAGALAAGIAVAVLVFVRRLTLKSFVPYGPFLILGPCGSFWVYRSRDERTGSSAGHIAVVSRTLAGSRPSTVAGRRSHRRTKPTGPRARRRRPHDEDAAPCAPARLIAAAGPPAARSRIGSRFVLLLLVLSSMGGLFTSATPGAVRADELDDAYARQQRLQKLIDSAEGVDQEPDGEPGRAGHEDLEHEVDARPAQRQPPRDRRPRSSS